MGSSYENLPVYKAALNLTSYTEVVVKNFNRHHKYVIGNDLRQAAHRIHLLVAKANTKESRTHCLAEAIDKLEEMKLLVHVCREIKAFNKGNSVEHSIRLIVDVSRQCEGWLRSQNSPSVRSSGSGHVKK